MQLEEITLALFAACNSLRVLAYLPQIHKAAVDKNGASAISRTTWSLFLVANVSTIAYALVNRSDPGLAVCFASNALCCVTILTIAWWRGRRCTPPMRGLRLIAHAENPEPPPQVRAPSRGCATSMATPRAVMVH